MIVLDASAFLAYALREPGELEVERALPSAVMSSVNFCEVINRLARDNPQPEFINGLIEKFGASLKQITGFNEADIASASLIHVQSRFAGLSLGDCICIALGQKLNAEVWTCDRRWAELEDAGRIRVIR